MKIFLLKQIDFDALTAALDRDPKHGYDGGSSAVLSPEEEAAFESAHRLYNYQTRKWISKMQQDGSGHD